MIAEDTAGDLAEVAVDEAIFSVLSFDDQAELRFWIGIQRADRLSPVRNPFLDKIEEVLNKLLWGPSKNPFHLIVGEKQSVVPF